LESLIARQLIIDEAINNKLDRTPDVMQARERANAQIISQAYMQGIVSKVVKHPRLRLMSIIKNIRNISRNENNLI